MPQAWRARPSKFRPRPIGPKQIARERLLSLVDAPARSRLLLVHAPAGFGKSTLLIQWHQRLVARGEGVGWVTIDDDDNGSGRFARTLCEALAPGHPQEDADLFDCINLSLAARRGFTLFLDEVEHLVAPEALHLLEVVVEHSPGDFHLAIGSRSLPQVLVRKARFMADAHLVSTEQLAFDRLEIDDFLRHRGCVGLDARLCEDLAQRTGGWAAAMQLAAAAVTEGESPRAVIDHLTGPSAGLVRYLGDEVLARLPPAQARFLLQTSFLRELAAPLCDAVTASHGAKEMLQEIEEHNLLLLQLDTGRAWYRYHPLFAECLRRHLDEERPGELATLARRASDWCAAAGMDEDAAEYALLSRDAALYLPRLDAAIDGLIAHAQFATADRWLRSIPPEILVARPELLTWSAWVGLYENDFAAAQQALEQCQQLAERGVEVPLKERLSGMILGVMLLLQRHRFEDAAALTDATAALAPAKDRHAQVRVTNLRALLAQLRGDLEAAGVLAARALRIATASPPIWLSYVHAAHLAGLTELAGGNLVAAREHFLSPGRALARERATAGAARRPIISLLAAPWALTLFEQNQLEEAEELLDRHEPFLNDFFSPTSRTLWYQLRARLHGLGEDQERLDAVIRAGCAYAAQHGLAWMESAIRWEAVAHELRQGRRDAARLKASPLLAELPLGQDARWIQSCDEVFGPRIGAIRYFIHSGAAQLALQLLAPEIARAATQVRRLRLAKLRALEAMALTGAGQHEASLAAMGAALALGKACGLVRTFVDEGEPCLAILRALDRQAPEETGTPDDAYRRHLIPAFGTDHGAEGRPPAQGERERADPGPLSTRELQIIAKLAQGHSNLVVSQQLFLSPNTIKWHLSQIYSKLGVGNRTQAVRAAQQQGLIDRN